MRIRPLFALLILPAALVGADPISDTWARVYARMPSLAQRYAVMQSISELSDPDLAPFLQTSLTNLLGTRERITGTDEANRTSLIRLIVAELGKYRSIEAAPEIWEVVQEIEDPVVRSEALATLGLVGATDYVDEVALLLRNLSLYRGQRVPGEETIAWGAVTALERLHHADGYAAVFSAARAGFSDPLTKLAEGALVRMLADPTPVLMQIVATANEASVELAAVRWATRSSAPPESKGRLAAAALEHALDRTTRTVVESTQASTLRSEAAGAIASARGPATAVPLLGRVLNQEAELGETLAAVAALGSIRSAQASAVLSERLRTFNDRQASGLVPSTEQLRVLVSVIQALGDVGGDLALAELTRTQLIDTYTGSVIREARTAADKIRSRT